MSKTKVKLLKYLPFNPATLNQYIRLLREELKSSDNYTKTEFCKGYIFGVNYALTLAKCLKRNLKKKEVVK